METASVVGPPLDVKLKLPPGGSPVHNNSSPRIIDDLDQRDVIQNGMDDDQDEAKDDTDPQLVIDEQIEQTSQNTEPNVLENHIHEQTSESDCNSQDTNEDSSYQCGECLTNYITMQEYMGHTCTQSLMAAVTKNSAETAQSEDKMAANVITKGNNEDGENFEGKIVYNPDGSAYIIEPGDSDFSDDADSLLEQTGSIVDKRGKVGTSDSTIVPQIANAVYIRRNPASYYDAMYSYPQAKTEAPVMHSYRVYDVRNVDSDSSDSESNGSGCSRELDKSVPSVPLKPILMCFICKLSFVNAKSFVGHAQGEHSMKLSEKEKGIMSKPNASGIIQGVGKRKEPLMSFLEPNLTAALGSSLPTIPCIDGKQSGTRAISVNIPVSSNDTGVEPSMGSNPKPGNVRTEREDDPEVVRSPGLMNGLQASPETQNRLNNNEPTKTDTKPDQGLVIKVEPTGDLPMRAPLGSTASSVPNTPNTPVTPNTPWALNFGMTLQCDEHPQGKQQGVECPKCDMVLGSTRSLGGHMTMMHSRNSCKTLKCPKCNWHYKYQETLEIHMKEKHPDNDTQCIYCITNQAHPRLARGESYSCGYKPYRCEVCNYSTTTKGNLSIHMQSDKHINNMQDMQNNASGAGVGAAAAPASSTIAVPSAQEVQVPTTPTTPHTPTPSGPEMALAAATAAAAAAKKVQKPKPTWRCDVCNYETNVARNLRIHMTSEKHTHNMMVLQQNVKDMQRGMHIQMQMGMDPSAMLGLASPMASGMMGFQFDPSMLMTPIPANLESAMDLTKDQDNGEISQPIVDRSTTDPANVYSCSVCGVFTADSIEALHQHMQADRSKTNGGEFTSILNGSYVCNMCKYKTNLKANFQLHCKTDKHLQKLQIMNHVKEGGASNEWRLQYINISNPIQAHCNACDYYTNSIHKLQVHSTEHHHQACLELFTNLRRAEQAVTSSDQKYYYCHLCSFATKTKLRLILHARTMKHMQYETVLHMNTTKEGRHTAFEDVFTVKTYTEDDIIKFDDEKDGESGPVGDTETTEASGSTEPEPDCQDDQHMCPYCNYTSPDASRIRAHVLTQHTQNDGLLCPLCQENFPEKPKLGDHLVKAHNVSQEGLQKLLVMVEPSSALDLSQDSAEGNGDLVIDEEDIEDEAVSQDPLDPEAIQIGDDGTPEAIVTCKVSDDGDDSEQYRCQTCTKTFINIDELYAHQNELGHLELKQTPRGPGYLCWKKGCNQYFKTAQYLQIHFREIHAKRQTTIISDRHVYKYRCSSCSLAFKTAERLQNHQQYHAIRAATTCPICERSFRTLPAVRKHVEASHMESMTKVEHEHFQKMLSANPLSRLEVTDENSNEGTIEDQNGGSSNDGMDEDFLNSQAIAEDSYSDPTRKYKCHRCKVAFTKQSYLSAHNKTLLHRRGDKANYPMEKFLDPNRPFKCETCRESFTQKNILLVHYNSVSHLHKLKQLSQQEGGKSGHTSETSSPSMGGARNGSPVTRPPSLPVVSSGSLGSTSTTSPIFDKPYKCNICKVAYTQGSTLDIHMRSVLHQTRASKIHELVMTGQVDITQPLIEQTDNKAQHQHKKALADMLQQKQAQQAAAIALATSRMPPIGQPPVYMQQNPNNAVVSSSATPTLAEAKVEQPTIKSEKMEVDEQEDGQEVFTCNKCGSIFNTQEAMVQHQQIYCYFSGGMLGRSRGAAPRYTTQLQKNLLENFGFECVMQFNEYNQRRRKNEEQRQQEEAKKELEEKVEMNLPEMNKSVCLTCGKQFSSIWVLKSHEEEIHRDRVPITFVEKCGEDVKGEFEKKKDEVQEEGEDRQPQSSSKMAAPTSHTPTSSTSSHTDKDNIATPQPPMTPLEFAQIASQMSYFGMVPMPMPLMGMGMPFMPFMPPGMDPTGMAAAMAAAAASSPSNFPSLSSLPSPGGLTSPNVDPGVIAMQKQQQSAQQQALASQKRARTRINDEQLKILRAHFDINNSPSEEQINVMAEQSGLPQKVIKHWFRNTLFKERQRNKDSPYNFNNPPSTTINMEEYEKTGKTSNGSSENGDEEKRSLKIDLPEVDDDNDSIFTDTTDPVPPTPSTPYPTASAASMHKSFSNMFASVSSIEEARDRDYGSLTSPPSTYVMTSATPSMSHASESSMCGSSGGGRRANRTRFTDYQIRMLQEYFEQNAYPKDDDLDLLSRNLNLNPRVIVVWFQNARQKARKVYENQPAADPTSSDESNGKFQRTPALNYQCKKCQSVFQRYYELIKHQKKYCYKDEDISPNAVFGNNEDSNSESSIPSSKESYKTEQMIKQEQDCEEDEDDEFYDDESMIKESKSEVEKKESKTEEGAFKCEKCNLQFNRFDLWQEHQNVHLLNPNLFPPYASSSAFAMLQNVAHAHKQNSEVAEGSDHKRKLSDDEDEEKGDDQHKDKRLRTTIHPEQLDYLYQKYQQDCNPSRKQLEAIASNVGLKKRVVQVWFQNTRARERKGQYRVHTQLIHKRCPFCRALFRAKTALESHLATKHPEELAKGTINIDDLPDAAVEVPNSPLNSTGSGSPSPSPTLPADMARLMANQFPGSSFMPPFLSPSGGRDSDSLLNIKKVYEESLKKYLDDIGGGGLPSRNAERSQSCSIFDTSPRKTSTPSRSASTSKGEGGEEAPLDLSKPVRINVDTNQSQGPHTDLSDDSKSEVFSETDLDDSSCVYTHSNPVSPSSTGNYGNVNNFPGKRYRTQLTSSQINVMKLLFFDYKTPTMAECEMLGQEIGLPKRVIQVWFQNARAKEKKAKLNYQKTFGTDIDFTRPSSECKVCNFKYSHKCTVQDHIFTKGHINSVKKKVEMKGAKEQQSPRDPPESTSVVNKMLQDSDKARKASETSDVDSSLAQLHAMGLNPASIPTLAKSRTTLGDSKKENVTTPSKTTADARLDAVQAKMAEGASSAALMSPFAAGLPGMDGFLPYMYPGLGLFPGMGMIPGMMPPGMFPGTESLLFDPTTYGTHLAMLQIPQQAIRTVVSKIAEAGSQLAQYTQDCQSVSDLKKVISSTDYQYVDEAPVDVGYICKKCQMVYPQQDACYTHQKQMCYPGKNLGDLKSVLKLEQIQYRCAACSEKFSTVAEFKGHCSQAEHKAKATK